MKTKPILRLYAFLAVLTLLSLTHSFMSHLAARKKLANVEVRNQEVLDIEVTVRFKPEGFHIQRLQKAGRLTGVDQRTVHLKKVEPAAMRDVARLHWIEAVALATDE